MAFNERPFFFEANFSFGVDSVFTDVQDIVTSVTPPTPPPTGSFLLETDDTQLLLTDGGYLALA